MRVPVVSAGEGKETEVVQVLGREVGELQQVVVGTVNTHTGWRRNVALDARG